jgi:hypothetical protein
MLNREPVIGLLDLDVFFMHYSWSSAKVIYRELNETDDEYIYIYYTASITRGDWNLNDMAVLQKTELRVNKATGEYTDLKSLPPSRRLVLNKVEISSKNSIIASLIVSNDNSQQQSVEVFSVEDLDSYIMASWILVLEMDRLMIDKVISIKLNT